MTAINKVNKNDDTCESINEQELLPLDRKNAALSSTLSSETVAGSLATTTTTHTGEATTAKARATSANIPSQTETSGATVTDTTNSTPTTTSNRNKINDFLSTMTFASINPMPSSSIISSGRKNNEDIKGVGDNDDDDDWDNDITMMMSRNCDCDECFCYSGGNSIIPDAIKEAIRVHKRRKIESMPLKRTQQRTLIQQSTNEENKFFSIWKLILPLNAEPLVEFGNSHRFIWIETFSTSSKIKTIGQGVVGSYDEENSRKIIPHLKQGNVYIVPSNGGKAVGWIHTIDSNNSSTVNISTTVASTDKIASNNNDNDTNGNSLNNSSAGAHAVFYICKIPVSNSETLLAGQSNTTRNNHGCDDDQDDNWVKRLQSVCHEELLFLEQKEKKNGETAATTTTLDNQQVLQLQWQQLNETNTQLVKRLIRKFATS